MALGETALPQPSRSPPRPSKIHPFSRLINLYLVSRKPVPIHDTLIFKTHVFSS
jgi:hypothetical protein